MLLYSRCLKPKSWQPGLSRKRPFRIYWAKLFAVIRIICFPPFMKASFCRHPTFAVFAAALSIFTAGVLLSADPSEKRPQHDMRTPWGRATDPDGDCAFLRSKDCLAIVVPGSEKAHDLAADIQVLNAPRVLQTAEGDFTLQVRVDGRFQPGEGSTQPGRTAYNGAALVAMKDPNNVVTLARAVLWDGETRHYANFEIRVNGQLQRIGLTNDHPLPEKGPVYLRLERRGNKMLGSVSTNGADWVALAAKEIPEDWPAKLEVGLAAISTSKDEFIPRFSLLQILK